MEKECHCCEVVNENAYNVFNYNSCFEVVTGHGNIKAYLHKYKIQESPICSYKRGEQTVDHVIYDCKLFEEERDRLKAAVMRTDNWPVSENNLIKNFNKDFIRSTNFINFDKL